MKSFYNWRSKTQSFQFGVHVCGQMDGRKFIKKTVFGYGFSLKRFWNWNCFMNFGSFTDREKLCQLGLRLENSRVVKIKGWSFGRILDSVGFSSQKFWLTPAGFPPLKPLILGMPIEIVSEQRAIMKTIKRFILKIIIFCC